MEFLYTASLSGEGAARAVAKMKENRSSWKSKIFDTNLINLQIKKERKTDPRTCMLPSPVHPLDSACANDPPSFQAKIQPPDPDDPVNGQESQEGILLKHSLILPVRQKKVLTNNLP